MDKILRQWFMLGSVSSVAYASGMAILLSIVLNYCFASAGILVGIPISAFILPISFVLAEVIIARYCTWRCFLWATLICVVAWSVSILLGGLLYDCSWDGIEYHQVTVYALADGWNPIWNDGYVHQEWLTLWTKHYAYALEMLSSCIFRFTGDVESGKGVNYLLAIASFLICVNVIKSVKTGWSKWKIVSITLIMVCNPVWIAQAPTFYIDFALYFYILLTISFSIGITKGNNVGLNTLGLSGVIVFAIGTKFNHFFIEGVSVLAILGWLLISGHRGSAWKVFKISAVAAIIGFFVFAFHPYLTNWTNYGTPFYPLVGEDAVDIMSYNTPAIYQGNNRVVNFLLSIYGELTLPVFDSRVSGFGLIFNLLFTVCILCILFFARTKDNKFPVEWYMALCIIGSCLFFEQSWWARYNPQLWMIVPLAYYSVLGMKSSGKRMIIVSIVGILAVINILSAALLPAVEALRVTVYRNAVFEVLEGKRVQSHLGGMWNERLIRHGVFTESIENDSVTTEHKVTVIAIPDSHVNRDNWLYVSAEDKARIDSLYENNIVCIARKRAIDYGKPTYRSIKSKLGWKSSD